METATIETNVPQTIPADDGRRPEDRVYDDVHAVERGRRMEAYQVQGGKGNFIPETVTSKKSGPAFCRVEDGKIYDFTVKPAIDRGLMKEIEKIIFDIPAREAKNKAAQERIADHLAKYRYSDAQTVGQTLKLGEAELARLRLTLPDRIDKFPARWKSEVARLAAFRDELAAIISEIDAEISNAEKEGAAFLAAHAQKAKAEK